MGKTHRAANNSKSFPASSYEEKGDRGKSGKARVKQRANRQPHNYHSLAERNFSTYLTSHGLKLHDIEGDGNCLFRSVAHQLYDNSERHLEIRQRVVSFLAQNWTEYVYYVVDEDSFASNAKDLLEMSMDDMKEQYDDYVKEMGELGTWGSQLELVAVTQAFHCHIVVHQPDAPTYILHSPSPMTPIKYLQVSFHGDCHYNSIEGAVPVTLLTPNSNNSTSSSANNSSNNSLILTTPTHGNIQISETDWNLIKQALPWTAQHNAIYAMYFLLHQDDQDTAHFCWTSEQWKDKVMDFLCVNQEEVEDCTAEDVQDMLPDGFSANIFPAATDPGNANTSSNSGSHKKGTDSEPTPDKRGKKKKPVILSKKEQRKLEKQQLSAKQRRAEAETTNSNKQAERDLCQQMQSIVL